MDHDSDAVPLPRYTHQQRHHYTFVSDSEQATLKDVDGDVVVLVEMVPPHPAH